MKTDGAGIRLLIVDDNPNFRRLLRAILSSISTAEIAEAENGAQALELLERFSPSLMLVDWCMSPMSGAEFITHVRTHPSSPNPVVPIIVVTGYAESGLSQQIRDVGADDFVVKPVSPRTVLGRILRVLQTPRPYVRVGDYMGPDRRRRTVANLSSDRRLANSRSAKVDG